MEGPGVTEWVIRSPPGAGGSVDQVEIRRRRLSDLPECVRVLREVHEADRYPDRWPEDPQAWLLPDADSWIAVTDGRILGHVSLVDRDDALWVSRLLVRPGTRGQQIGELLLEAARTRGTLMLDVIEHSEHAIRLYERTGWTLIDTRPANWIMADGTRPVEHIYTSN